MTVRGHVDTSKYPTLNSLSGGANLRRPESGWATIWARWRRAPMALFGGSLFLVLVLVSVLGSWLLPIDPLKQDLTARNRPPGWTSEAGKQYYAGTDHLGRDLASRLVLGTRISLLVGTLGVAGAAVVGVAAGAVAGFLGGKTDSVIMRIVDIQMSFPFILIAIIWASLAGTGLWSIVLIIAFRGWVVFARIVRSRILAIRELAFVDAARATGLSTPRIVVRHVLPQTTSSIVIIVALQLGVAVIFESTLGFLGLGIQPPTPTLGGMLADGRVYTLTAWWLVILPGALLTLIVIAINTFGDGLRDVLDPRGSQL